MLQLLGYLLSWILALAGIAALGVATIYIVLKRPGRVWPYAAIGLTLLLGASALLTALAPSPEP